MQRDVFLPPDHTIIRFDLLKLIRGDKDDETKSRAGFSSLSKTGKKKVSYEVSYD